MSTLQYENHNDKNVAEKNFLQMGAIAPIIANCRELNRLNHLVMTSEKEPKSKIAVFGSAFNPPTLGHKSVIESLAHFDKVLLVPSISHAWGKEMLGFSTRCQMVELFIKELDIRHVELSTIEQALVQPQESVTTFAVLQALEQQYPDADFTFVIGPDNLLSFHKFYKAEQILKRWGVMACPEKVKVRSTQIRERLKSSQSTSELTTSFVNEFIRSNKLYLS